MSKIDVKKQGNVFTVFLDTANGQTGRIQHFDDQPGGYFPFMIRGEAELRSKFPGAQFNFVQENLPPQPIAKRPSEEALKQFLGNQKKTESDVRIATDDSYSKASMYVRMQKKMLDMVTDKKAKEVIRLQIEGAELLISEVWPDGRSKQSQ